MSEVGSGGDASTSAQDGEGDGDGGGEGPGKLSEPGHQPEPGHKPEAGTAGPAVYCFWCGKQEPTTPLTWSLVSTSARGPQLLCEACTRVNLRSIESQLSTDWW